jgi:hypothetical protein
MLVDVMVVEWRVDGGVEVTIREAEWVREGL